MNINQRIKIDPLLQYTAKGSQLKIPKDYLIVNSTQTYGSGATVVELTSMDKVIYRLCTFNDQMYLFQHLFTLDSEEPEMIDCDKFMLEYDTEDAEYEDYTGLYEDFLQGKKILLRLYKRKVQDIEEFLMGYINEPNTQEYYVGIQILKPQVTEF